MIRVVLADDHAGVREGIRLLLARASDIKVVGEAHNGVQALELVHQLQPDVLILDVQMPGLKGADVARLLQLEKSPVAILALSAHGSQGFVRGMFAAGAAGYLRKDDAPAALIHAVRSVSRGDRGWIGSARSEDAAVKSLDFDSGSAS